MQKYLLALVAAFATIAPTAAFAQQSVMRQYTVAQLPSAASSNGVFAFVQDGVSPTDCSTGGGAFVVGCVSNGTQWTAKGVGSSASGSLIASNAGTGGTALNKLAKLSGAPSTLLTALTSDTTGIMGVCIAGCGTTGSATIQTYGLASVAVDNATVAGDYLVVSSTAAGSAHDAGATYPNTVQIIGRVIATNASAGTDVAYIFPSEIRGPALAGAVKLVGTGSVTPTAINDGACAQQGTTITVTGANVGDPVSVGSTAAQADGIDLFGKVTATNTITLEICNISGAAATPASGTFTATVVH